MPVILFLVLSVAVSPLALAEAAPLNGRVLAAASLERPVPLSAAVDSWACGEDGTIADPRLVIGRGRGIANVVVRVLAKDGAPPYPAAGPPMTIDQKGCVFLPHLVITAPGAEVRVTNSDRVLHTFRTKARLNSGVNKAQTAGAEDLVRFTRPEIITAACDVHHWMSAVIVVAEHAWTTATDGEGRFFIEGLAPGSYQLELWHETLGSRRVAAEVGVDGGSVELVWGPD